MQIILHNYTCECVHCARKVHQLLISCPSSRQVETETCIETSLRRYDEFNSRRQFFQSTTPDIGKEKKCLHTISICISSCYVCVYVSQLSLFFFFLLLHYIAFSLPHSSFTPASSHVTPAPSPPHSPPLDSLVALPLQN